MSKNQLNKSITLLELKEEMNLIPLTTADYSTLISETNIYRIGYEVTGFFQCEMDELQTQIHIIGKKEGGYLKSLTEEKRKNTLEQYFSYNFPLIVLSQDCEVPHDFLEIAEKMKKPIFRSNLRTTEFIREMKSYLQQALSKEVIIQDHVFLEIYGVGVLVGGYDEAKIGVTVELLERGHKIITDNNLIVKKIGVEEIQGSNRFLKTKDAHFFLTNTDGSIIDVTTNFGIKGTRSSKRIDLIIKLEKWNEKEFYDRLGLDTKYKKVLGVNIPVHLLPVRRGRNLAVIIETAAMNHRLKKMGIDSAKHFWKETKKIIETNKLRKEAMGNQKIKELAVKDFIKKFDLEVIHGEEYVEQKYIRTTGIHKPSLALTGYFDMYEEEGYNGVQIFSEIEFDFLDKISKKNRDENLCKYLNYDFPIIVLPNGIEIPKYFYNAIEGKNLVVCRGQYKKTSHMIAVFSSFLEAHFAPSVSMHGVFLELYGFGVLLVGKSGVGKSETALELIHRGHRLVADDIVKFVKTPNGEIIGKADKLPYFMEIRGLGIIDIKTLYGLGSVRISKKLDAIIELKEQKSGEYLTSVNYMHSDMDVIDVKFDKAELYISSGRNAAAMVEIAVMNLMAKRLGHDPEKAFDQGISRLTLEEREILDLNII